MDKMDKTNESNGARPISDDELEQVSGGGITYPPVAPPPEGEEGGNAERDKRKK